MDSGSWSEPGLDSEAEGVGDAGGDGLRDVFIAGFVVVDLRFCFGSEEVVVVVSDLRFLVLASFLVVLGFGADDGPSLGDARGRGGLKGSRRRFWGA